MMTLEARRALLWFRKHQPATWPRHHDPDCPGASQRVALIRAGLIAFSPERKHYDPITYSLTAEGRKALEL